MLFSFVICRVYWIGTCQYCGSRWNGPKVW